MQVVTNSYKIKLNNFANAYLKAPENDNKTKKYMGISIVAVITFLTSIYLYSDSVGDGIHFVAFAVIPAFLEAEKMAKKKRIKADAEALGYNDQTMFAVITPDDIMIMDESNQGKKVNKAEIEKIIYHKGDYLIFKQNKQLVIVPKFAFANKMERKLFTKNYFVHYS